MSSSRLPPPKPSERVGATRKMIHERIDADLDSKAHLRAWLHSHKASLIDSLRRLARQPIGSFFTCLVMAVALSLPMGLALLLDSVERLGGSWQRAAQISVYLDLKASDARGRELTQQIADFADVAEAQWISREQALEEFQQLSGLGQALQDLPENPLPGVVLVTPKEIDRAALNGLQQKLSELKDVQQAQLDLLWVERLTAILGLGERFVFGLTLLLVLALLLVMGNTIRLHIENRRVEIEVIKLVGGTDGYVRRPFLYMGAIYGLGAGLLAWMILLYGLNWLDQAVVRLAGLYDSDFALIGVPGGDAFSLVLGAVLLGYVGAWLAVARHLRELAPR